MWGTGLALGLGAAGATATVPWTLAARFSTRATATTTEWRTRWGWTRSPKWEAPWGWARRPESGWWLKCPQLCPTATITIARHRVATPREWRSTARSDREMTTLRP